MEQEATQSARSSTRVLVLGAHPDDAEVHAGGLIVRHCQNGSQVKIVSVTDGRSGHHEVSPERLAKIRKAEAQAAGERVGAEYVTWDFPDGSLEPSLQVREAIIREVRTFQPDLVLTHRPYDYHPDHRAVGLAVQDASYLVTVPNICIDVPALGADPVVAYMCDQFTRPCRFRADVLLDIAREYKLVLQMASCHGSQFYEWLPYHAGILQDVPESSAERLGFLDRWFESYMSQRRAFFRTEIAACCPADIPMESIQPEVFEISEYARQVSDKTEFLKLFPDYLPNKRTP